jgi:ATP-dependent DNA helicase RecG
MINFNTPITSISRIGKSVSKQLAKLGVHTALDLLFYFPYRYDDFSRIIRISDINWQTKEATVKGKIELIENTRSKVKRKLLTEALIFDGTGRIKAIWFNQPYLVKVLKSGETIYLSGRVDSDFFGVQFVNPSYEKIKVGQTTTHTARIVPVYSVTSNLTSKQVRYLVKLILPLAEKVNDWLPEEIRKELKFCDLKTALQQIHFPANRVDLEKARHRLKFDELFLIQLQTKFLRKELQKYKAPKIKFLEKETKDFVANLPFRLTDAQRKAGWQILKDLEKSSPMNRLLEGDVGSGKTVVAALAILNVAHNGYQTVLMAPTEILAKQHYDTFCKLFSRFNIKIGLVTRSIKTMNYELRNVSERKKQEIIINDSDLIIGTHALLEEKIRFKNLALAIVDEQHRFGVEQRAALLERTDADCVQPSSQKSVSSPCKFVSSSQKSSCHFLSMTATPIPRTLALAFYGDLDLSIIDQMPVGRKKVITRVIAPQNRMEAYNFVRNEIKNGRQAFVICPLIDPSDKLGVKAATTEYKKLSQEIFPDLKIGLLHGRMKAKEKEKIMQDFLENKINVLVSTSVVEVGVNVPNATIMLIEGAERFGLAQLHQFRGRVGRSDFQSYCFLFFDNESSEILKRLYTFVKCSNGFELAEKDLEFRGPGEIYGTRQHGIPNLKIAELTDYQIIKEAAEQAENIMAHDPDLIHFPLLKAKLEEFQKKVHLE